VVFLTIIWMTFIDQRPFWVVTTDPEQDYYFNSLSVLDQGYPESVRHPGTPVYYLGALILAITGTEFSEAQRFFNVTYLLAVLTFIASIALFTRIALRKVPFAPSFLILTSLFVWPPFLTYSNYFSVESFLYPLGVVMSALTFSVLTRRTWVPGRWLIQLGFVIGLGLSLKFSFLPLGITAVLLIAGGIIFSHTLSRWRESARFVLFNVAILTLFALVSFLLLIAPVVRFMHILISRLEAATGGLNLGSTSGSGSSALGRLTQLAPEFVVLSASAIFGFVILLVVRKYVRRGSERFDEGIQQVSHPGQIAVLILAFIVFGLVAARTIDDPNYLVFPDTGVFLRNLTPLAAFLPLVLLVVWRLFASTWPDFRDTLIRRRTHDVLLVGIAAALTITSVGGYLSWRGRNYDDVKDVITLHSDTVRALAPEGSRIAIWGLGRSFGEPAFFFWGNYRYSFDTFDEKVLEAYPEYTILRGNDLGMLVPEILEESGVNQGTGAVPLDTSSVGLMRGPVQDLYDSIMIPWRERYPERPRSGEMITGEYSVDDISVLVYRPEHISFLLNGGDDAEQRLYSAFENRFGEIEVSQIQIGAEAWTVLRLGER
jgi:hypothetical protein